MGLIVGVVVGAVVLVGIIGFVVYKVCLSNARNANQKVNDVDSRVELEAVKNGEQVRNPNDGNFKGSYA